MSFNQLHSFVPHTLHYTTFAARQFASAVLCFIHTDPNHKRKATALRKNPTLHYSLGFISLLRHFFISAGFSPPAALFSFARRPPHLDCIHLAAANCSCRTSISQSIAKLRLHSSAASVPCGEIYSGGFLWSWHQPHFVRPLLPAPLWGLAVRLRSFVPHSLRRPTGRLG